MNNVVIIGRLTRDPEVRYTEAQLAIARFSLAVDRPKFGSKENQEATADFINIVVFGKTAENVEKYLNKGNQIAIQGRLQTGSYVNKDGVKVYTTDVVADRVEFLNTKTKNGEDMPDGLEDIKDEIPF